MSCRAKAPLSPLFTYRPFYLQDTELGRCGVVSGYVVVARSFPRTLIKIYENIPDTGVVNTSTGRNSFEGVDAVELLADSGEESTMMSVKNIMV